MISKRQPDQRKQKRRRVRHEKSFADRLADEIRNYSQAAADASPGMERELLLKRVRQAETALYFNQWLRTPAAPEEGRK